MITHALVTFRLDYCDTLHMGWPMKMSRKRQLVQNAVSRYYRGGEQTLSWVSVCMQKRPSGSYS